MKISILQLYSNCDFLVDVETMDTCFIQYYDETNCTIEDDKGSFIFHSFSSPNDKELIVTEQNTILIDGVEYRAYESFEINIKSRLEV